MELLNLLDDLRQITQFSCNFKTAEFDYKYGFINKFIRIYNNLFSLNLLINILIVG